MNSKSEISSYERAVVTLIGGQEIPKKLRKAIPSIREDVLSRTQLALQKTKPFELSEEQEALLRISEQLDFSEEIQPYVRVTLIILMKQMCEAHLAERALSREEKLAIKDRAILLRKLNYTGRKYRK